MSGVSGVHVCMHEDQRVGGSRGMLPQEICCSEIASEAILGQKQRIVPTWLTEYCIQFLAAIYTLLTFAKPVDIEFS